MADNPKFTILHESMKGKTFEIDKEVMSIGRRSNMDICIPDSSLSGHHADIIRGERNGKMIYTLRDNDSTNGTRINNTSITEQELKNSDLIMFGVVEVLFEYPIEKIVTHTTRTIDISNISSGLVQGGGNLNPLADQEAARDKNIQKATMILGILLGILAVAAGLYAILSIIK